MYLPVDLGDQVEKHCGSAPKAAARALYDLDGNLGESYAVATDHWLVLFSKRVGSEFTSQRFPMEEIADMAINDDRAFLYLDIMVAGKKFHLKFSSWDRGDLEQITDLWTEQSGRLAVEGETPIKTASTAPNAPATLSPLTAFCASVHAMIQADGHVDQVELNILQNAVPSRPEIEAGKHYLSQVGQESLLARLREALDSPQRLCLLANLIDVAMADGLLRSKEQRLLDQFREALNISEVDYQSLFDTLRIENQLAVFEEDPSVIADADLSPLAAFVAALYAMIQVDDNADPKELAVLWHLVDDHAATNQGMNFFARGGIEGVLHRVPRSLNHAQQLCLMANLLKVAMIDGVLRSSEQQLLTRFKEATGISDADYEALYDVLLLKNNLSVFASPVGSG